MDTTLRLCRNCKYWGRDYKGVCDFPEETNIKNSEHAFIRITVLDDSDLNIFLHTGPDFGCVKFQEK